MTDLNPPRLWHVTTERAADAIVMEGFATAWGNYFCVDILNAAKFVAPRAAGDDWNTWVGIEVNTDGLDVKRATADTIGGALDNWAVFHRIPPTAITRVIEVQFAWTGDRSTEQIRDYRLFWGAKEGTCPGCGRSWRYDPTGLQGRMIVHGDSCDLLAWAQAVGLD